jgi:hypothetical protein
MDKKITSKALDVFKSLISIKKLRSDEEVRFRLANSLKMLMIPVVSMIVTLLFATFFLELDLIFFESFGYPNVVELKEAYFDFIMSKSLELVPITAGFFVVLVFIGIYVSDILLRPFRAIGEYSEKATNSEKCSYDPEFFTDLKLLTRFSEWFFNAVEIAETNGQLKPLTVPEKYKKIHRPVFESAFFIQYSLFIFIVTLVSAIIVHMFAVDINDHIVSLAQKVLASKPEVNYFLLRQSVLFNNLMKVVIVAQVLAYFGLAIHLYNKVSSPAFGIFATMRSFITGNYKSRVHLIGFHYIRPSCRKLNKYLDKIEKDLVKKK